MRFALAVAVCLVFADSAIAAPPVLDCRDRLGVAVTIGPDGVRKPYRFKLRPGDLNLGPIAFAGLKSAGTLKEWNSYVTRDQWIKSFALVRPGARVTLTVPEEQRKWMRLVYGATTAGPVAEVTLVGCRRVKGAKARRRECGPRDQYTCQHDRTPFAGGFDIDYGAAPQQGRCAELLVAEPGKETRRVRLFAARCST